MADDTHSDFEQLLSPEDVARVCGLSRRAVYRAIARGELRAARLCHRLRVQPADLERWIGEQTLTVDRPARPERALPSRRWRVRWRDDQGRERSKVIGRKRDAEVFEAEVVRRKRTGDLDLLTGGRETLAEFAEE